MKFNVFESSIATAKALAEVVTEQLDGTQGVVVLPSGTDANMFYSELAKSISKNQANVTGVQFMQSEELCPISAFHPVSFAYQIRSRFVEHLSKVPDVLYLETMNDSVDAIVQIIAKRIAGIFPRIAIVGINNSGDVLGMTPILFSSNIVVNAIELTIAKWEAYLKKNGFFESYHHMSIPYLISLGAPLLCRAEQLYVLSTGSQKRSAIDDIREKIYTRTIGNLVQERQKNGLESEFFVDHAAYEN